MEGGGTTRHPDDKAGDSLPARGTITAGLQRLLRPSSVAVVGGGAWCRQAVHQLKRFGFTGQIWRVHPSADTVEGITACARLADLPAAPDAAFIGVNRHATVEAVSQLARMGAGGAVCFASGFAEARAEDAESGTLQATLAAAAGDMPILGPNCYGFINALDRALLWPDQHGCTAVAGGVAILTQSSNIAINLTMQKRGLPIGFVGTCGNMARVSQATLAMTLLDDVRITAIGLHVEGVGDTAEWHALAVKAHERGVPLVALKIGMSQQARHGALSHTGSLAGSAAGACALFDYLGIPLLRDLPEFLETLKLLHLNGPLDSPAISSISCSGGEAGLMADLATAQALELPPLTSGQKASLEAALGPMVAVSNPLDYHTYIWGDAARMAAAWLPMTAPHVGITLIVLDYPHTDARAWQPATAAAIAVRAQSARPVAVVTTLPELMPPEIMQELIAAEVIPLLGMREALAAVEAAASCRPPQTSAPAPPSVTAVPRLLSEAEAKAVLASYGMPIPRGFVAARGALAAAAAQLIGPFALKALGYAHKSESGAVRLGLSLTELEAEAEGIPATDFLVEEMITGGIVELLIGVIDDPAHGIVLSLGAGGVLTELWQDTVRLLLPTDAQRVAAALGRLRIAPLLAGYRGKAGVPLEPVVEAVLCLQDCVLKAQPRILEAEVNPLICTAQGVVAADALIAVADA